MPTRKAPDNRAPEPTPCFTWLKQSGGVAGESGLGLTRNAAEQKAKENAEAKAQIELDKAKDKFECTNPECPARDFRNERVLNGRAVPRLTKPRTYKLRIKLPFFGPIELEFPYFEGFGAADWSFEVRCTPRASVP